MKIKTVKTCEACEQPFEADRRVEGRQACCSKSACQLERRRHSQRRVRAAKSSLNQPSDEISIGGGNSSRLQAASGLVEAQRITEDPFTLGLMSMLCDTEDLNGLQAMIMRLRKRGMGIVKKQTG